MELKHQFVVPATMEDTWTAFNDIESVAGCFPGASLEKVDGDEFTGSVKIKLGPISMVYSGGAEMVERNEVDRRIVIRARGKDKRGQGTAEATVTAVLAGHDASTLVDVNTDLAITGRPAQFGRGMIQDISERLLGQFVDALSAQLSAPGSSRGEAPSGQASGGEGDRGEAVPAPVRAPAERAATSAPPQINLFSTVLPVLLRRALMRLRSVAAFLLVGWLPSRRRRAQG
jgi:carbon monoxide dehydrogenase subunit G